MQPHQCFYACGNLTFPRLGLSSHCFHHRLSLTPLVAGLSISDGEWRGRSLKAKRKENIWSVDNDLAEKKALREKRRRNGARSRGRRRNGSPLSRRGKTDSPVLVSGPMLMEIERVLQTQVLDLFILLSKLSFSATILSIWITCCYNTSCPDLSVLLKTK